MTNPAKGLRWKGTDTPSTFVIEWVIKDTVHSKREADGLPGAMSVKQWKALIGFKRIEII